MHSRNGKPGQELWHSEYALGQHCIYEKDVHMTSSVEQLYLLVLGEGNNVSILWCGSLYCTVYCSVLSNMKLFVSLQGLQIFILYTVRTRVFQSEASKVLKSLSSSFDRVKPSDSWIPLGLRVRMYNMLRSIPSLNERFRLLEPSVVSEETSLSWEWPNEVKCLLRLLPMMVFLSSSWELCPFMSFSTSPRMSS